MTTKTIRKLFCLSYSAYIWPIIKRKSPNVQPQKIIKIQITMRPPVIANPRYFTFYNISRSNTVRIFGHPRTSAHGRPSAISWLCAALVPEYTRQLQGSLNILQNGTSAFRPSGRFVDQMRLYSSIEAPPQSQNGKMKFVAEGIIDDHPIVNWDL